MEGRQLLTGPADQVYAALQQYQLQQQALATVHGTVDVGTFNATNGFFTGLGGSIWVTDPPDSPGSGPIGKPGKPHIEQGPPGVTYINSVNVALTFEVTNPRSGNFSVTVNNTTVSAAPGQRQVTIEIGQASHFDYTVRSGIESYSGSFDIIRPPHLGVATIPVIPLAVIYDAPQDKAGLNTNSLTQSSNRSTTVSVEYSQDSSTTNPGTIPGGYGDLMTVEKVLNGAAQVLSKTPGVPDTVQKGASIVQSLLSPLFGTVDYTHTDQTTNATSTTSGVSYTVSQTVTPTTHLGPGDGDLIEFISNARFLTVGWNGQATTAKLYDDGIQIVSVHFLKQRLAALGTSNAPDPLTGLDRTTIQALLGLDPLAGGGPNATLDPSRYADLGPLSVNGSLVNQPMSVTFTNSQMTSSTHAVTNVQSDKSGWLSFLGIGVTDDTTSKVTLTNKTSNTSSSSQTVTATINLHAGADEYYRVEVYYDTIFGSVLLREIPLPGGAAVKISSSPPAAVSQVGVIPAITSGATPTTSPAASQQARASVTASSPASAQISVRPNIVVSDPTEPPIIPQRKLVPQDAD
jgi:hypothetical protein